MKPLGTFRVPLLLAAIALLCYLPGITWGVPHANAPGRGHAWGVDDETPLGSLSEVRGIRRGPGTDRNLGYPLGHPLVVAAASAPYLGVLALTGGLQAGSSDYPHGLSDPVAAIRTLALIAHLVSVVFALAAVLAAWFAARDLWSANAGALAGLMVATSYPMFYYARTGNVDMAQLGWMACGLAAAARIVSRGLTVRRAVWLGVFVGAAVGTKEPIAAAFVALPPLLLGLQWWDHRAGRTHSTRWWLPYLAAGTGFVVAFGVLSGLFLDGERFGAHIDFAQGRVSDLAQGDVAFVSGYPWTIDGHLRLARLIVNLLSDVLTWPGLLLSVAGVAVAVRRHSRSAWLILPAITYLAVLFLSARAGLLRYVMPAAWVLALFAAHAAISAIASRRVLIRWAGVATAALMVALNLGRGLDLTQAMRSDSRYAAAAWLDDHAKAGSRIAYFGSDQKLPHLAPDVRALRAGEYRGAVVAVAKDDAAASRIVEGWRADPPDFILLMPDHSSEPGVPYPASCPPSLADALDDGRLGYQRAAFFETPPWLPWLRRPRLDYPTVNPPIRIYRRIPG